MPGAPDEVGLAAPDDVVRARQLVRRLAVDAGLGLVDQTRLVTAVSELARNTVIHGGGGSMAAAVVHAGGRVGVRAAFTDAGKGIPDVGAALQDGWTTGSGLGLGLGGARRLVHEFDVETAPGAGTCVTVVRWR